MISHVLLKRMDVFEVYFFFTRITFWQQKKYVLKTGPQIGVVEKCSVENDFAIHVALKLMKRREKFILHFAIINGMLWFYMCVNLSAWFPTLSFLFGN